MPALNFKSQFVEPIRARTKQHTIRGFRKDGKVPKVGEKYSLYCGMRTKNCFRILPELVTLSAVQPIQIFDNGLTVRDNWLTYTQGVRIDGQELATDELESLATADGFSDFITMMSFWTGRLPFEGHLIHWRDL